MRKTISVVAVAAVLALSAGQASARGGWGGGWHGGYGGGAIAGALVGGALLGAVVGSAVAAPPVVTYAQPVYADPGYPVAYAAPPVYGPPPGYCYDSYHRAYVECAPPPGYGPRW